MERRTTVWIEREKGRPRLNANSDRPPSLLAALYLLGGSDLSLLALAGFILLFRLVFGLGILVAHGVPRGVEAS